MKPKVKIRKPEIPEPEIPTQIDDITFFIIMAIIIIPFLVILLYLLKRFFKIKRTISIDNKKNIYRPIFPAALSILFPGIGQIYNKEIERGASYIVLTLSTWFVLFITLALTKYFDIGHELDLAALRLRLTYYSINTFLIIFLVFIYINSVIHKAFIEVNEEGLETGEEGVEEDEDSTEDEGDYEDEGEDGEDEEIEEEEEIENWEDDDDDWEDDEDDED